MTEPTLAELLAALTPEERAQVEAAAEKAAEGQPGAIQGAAEEKIAELYDARQDGKLDDPRSLGPTGG